MTINKFSLPPKFDDIVSKINEIIDNLISLIANYVTTDSDQNITGTKTFVGQKKIAFKQSGSSDKLGFTLYNNSGTEKGYLEYNPSNTVDSVPLMTLGNYTSTSGGLTHVGFRKYSSISGANGAYNLLAPLISDAKTPFSLTTTYTNFYLPLGFTNGTTTVYTAKTGMVDISSLLPNVSSYLQNTATGTNALTLLGTATNQSGSINIGYGSSVTNTDSVVIGESAESAYAQTVAIGYQANANDTSSTAIGYGAYTNYSQATAIGASSQATKAGTVAVGSNAQATQTQANAFGYNAQSTGYGSIALGYGAQASANYAIQIGNGTNSTASTLAVGFNGTNYQLLDGTTGLIPDARISSNIARTSAIPDISTKQDTLVSGTNIKTVNSTSLLGSGNIDTKEIFIAEYGVTTYAEISNALQNGKTVFLNNGGVYYSYNTAFGSYFQFSNIFNLRTNEIKVIYVMVDTSNVWSGSEYTIADTDLSNLSATGQAVIDGKVNNDDYYYKSGDTDSYSWYGGGYITSSGTEIWFSFPTPKSMAKITTVTCTALTTAFRKTAGGYMPSSGGNLWNAKANATVTVSKQTENTLSICVKYNNWGGTNNTPVGVLADISLSFT